MGIWQDIQAQISTIVRGKPVPGPVIAQVSPLWEQTTPQYPAPNPYALAQVGYRQNEILYACIRKRMMAVSEPPCKIYTGEGKKRKELANHPARKLLRRPNVHMGESEFWQAVEMYINIAGFTVWEAEFNRMGEPIALWPMRPDWCSFLRGEVTPLRAVRYQPPGLPWIDVPIERCLVLSEFDPIYPFIKGLSRTAVALRVATVDNAATDFLRLFFQNGAVVNGLLKTSQQLSEVEAKRIRKMWREQHGGVENWTDPAVLGFGVEYQQTQMDFKSMAFDAIDGRNEARICAIMETPPILIGAKVGIEASTYSNYKESREAFYDSPIGPQWRWYASEVTQQILPWYGDDPSGGDVYAAFDTSEVSALAEDRDAKWKRADMAYKGGWATRDEVREEAGLDPIDDGVPVFAGGNTDTGKDVDEPEESENETPIGGNPFGDIAENDAPIAPGQQPPTPPNAQPAQPPEPDEEQMKAWRRAALANVGAGVGAPFDAELFACKSKADVRAVIDKHWPRKTVAVTTLQAAIAELRRFNDLASA